MLHAFGGTGDTVEETQPSILEVFHVTKRTIEKSVKNSYDKP